MKTRLAANIALHLITQKSKQNPDDVNLFPQACIDYEPRSS